MRLPISRFGIRALGPGGERSAGIGTLEARLARNETVGVPYYPPLCVSPSAGATKSLSAIEVIACPPRAAMTSLIIDIYSGARNLGRLSLT